MLLSMQHQPYTLAQTQRSSPATAAPSQSIGNSVGKLQEYCVASNLVTPLYSFQEESLPGNSRKFIAEVKVWRSYFCHEQVLFLFTGATKVVLPVCQ